jgi:hypothetical protein
MTITYQLTESEFDYQFFKKIKSQFRKNGHPLKIKIEVEDIETDETDAIMANPYLLNKIEEGIKSVKNSNVITFTPEEFDGIIKKHIIHASSL